MHPTLLKSQYYKTPAATYFGPYRPIIRKHTTVQNICLTFSHVRDLPITLQYVIYIHICNRWSCVLEAVGSRAMATK